MPSPRSSRHTLSGTVCSERRMQFSGSSWRWLSPALCVRGCRGLPWWLKGLTQGHKSEFDPRAICCHRPSSSCDSTLPPYGVLAGQGWGLVALARVALHCLPQPSPIFTVPVELNREDEWWELVPSGFSREICLSLLAVNLPGKWAKGQKGAFSPKPGPGIRWPKSQASW